MTPKTTTAERGATAGGPRRAPSGSQARRLAGEAARTWGLLTLGGLVLLTWLVLWHLARRGRLLRERLGPPRPPRLSTADPREPPGSPPDPDEPPS